MSQAHTGAELLSHKLRIQISSLNYVREPNGELHADGTPSSCIASFNLSRSSAPATDNATTPEGQQRLAALVANMLEVAQRQLHRVDAVELEEAFGPLRVEVHKQSKVRLDAVILNSNCLSNIHETSVCVRVLRAFPEGLVDVKDELTSLSLNCCMIDEIPRCIEFFKRMAAFTLDGDRTFYQDLIRRPDGMLLYENGVQPADHGVPKVPGQLLRVPAALCLLIQLQVLCLKSLNRISSLPVNLSRLTSLRHLEIRNCPELLVLPDLGPMPALRVLHLQGALCLRLPVRVCEWQIEDVQLAHQVDDRPIVDFLPPGMWTNWASSLTKLSLGLCMPEHLQNMPLMPKLVMLAVKPIDSVYRDSDQCFDLRAVKVPNLCSVVGVTGFSYDLHTLKQLSVIRVVLDKDFGVPPTGANPQLRDVEPGPQSSSIDFIAQFYLSPFL